MEDEAASERFAKKCEYIALRIWLGSVCFLLLVAILRQDYEWNWVLGSLISLFVWGLSRFVVKHCLRFCARLFDHVSKESIAPFWYEDLIERLSTFSLKLLRVVVSLMALGISFWPFQFGYRILEYVR